MLFSGGRFGLGWLLLLFCRRWLSLGGLGLLLLLGIGLGLDFGVGSGGVGLRVCDGLVHHGLVVVHGVFEEEVRCQFFILIAGQVRLQALVSGETQTF